MNEKVETFGSLAVKTAVAQLDSYLNSKGVSNETREAISNSVEMMSEYVPYAIKIKKNPTDGKVLAEFLATKSIKMAKYFANDGVNCAMAIVEFLLSSNKAYGSTVSGMPPVIVTMFGLALLDLIEVGNKCEFAQAALYESILRESSVKIIPIRARVNATYCPASDSSTKKQYSLP